MEKLFIQIVHQISCTSSMGIIINCHCNMYIAENSAYSHRKDSTVVNNGKEYSF